MLTGIQCPDANVLILLPSDTRSSNISQVTFESIVD
ncbi:unnamed protein product, partial [Rotaria sp. Silwood2]